MKTPKSHELQFYWPQQSPIDLGKSLYTPDLPALSFQYPGELKGSFEDDHNFHIVGPKSATLTYDGLVCPLVKMHFHDPSEHTLDSATADLEAHLIHQVPGYPKDYPSAFIVVGVFYDSPKTKKVRNVISPEYHSLADALIPKFFERNKGNLLFDPNEFLPKDRSKFFKYEGALTTSPYNEFVSWIVMKQHGKLDTPIEYAVTGKTSEDAREVQPLNRRSVLRNFR